MNQYLDFKNIEFWFNIDGVMGNSKRTLITMILSYFSFNTKKKKDTNPMYYTYPTKVVEYSIYGSYLYQ